MILSKNMAIYSMLCIVLFLDLWQKGNVIGAISITVIYVLEPFILIAEFSSMFIHIANIKKASIF